MNNKKLTSIALSILLLTSSITVFGAFIFFPVQEAEAQGLQLRVSGAEFPKYENHFYGAQFIEIIIDDPGATDPDESTIGLQVRGETVPRVHLADGLWYQYTAEEDFFGIYLDLLTDGLRNNNIAVVAETEPTEPRDTVKIGADVFTLSTDPKSFVREITVGPGGFRFIEVQQNSVDGGARGLLPTIPQPFFEGPSTTLNPDLQLSVKPPVTAGNINDKCEKDDFDLPNTECDWPYIRVIPLNQREQLVIRAGSASVVLTFDEFPQSITTSLNRVSYPKDAEIMYKFNDFQWNINPQEVDQVFMVLNKDTGFIEKILNSPKGGIEKRDVLPIFPDLDFDHRQILELDDEGVESIAWVFAFSKSLDREVNFVRDSPPFVLLRENARLTSEFDDIENVFAPGSSEPLFIGDDQPGDLSPVVRINEASAKPNSGSFNTGQAGKGSRTTMFAGARDAVATFDYFDIITSAPMAVHDGFTSVDREVYDSADRSVFTVTDPDQNLRSSVSESPDGRDAKNIIRVGDPIPLINTRSEDDLGGIFDPDLNNVLQIWEAIFTSAQGDTKLLGLNYGGEELNEEPNIGANVLADVDDDGSIDALDAIGTTFGPEAFHAGEEDIVAVSGDDAFDLPIDNDKFAVVFTADEIRGDNPSAIIIDTSVTIEDINDVQFSTTATKAQILGQVRVNNLQEFGGSDLEEQQENFVTQVARITRISTDDVIGRDVALGLLGVGPIADDELLTVDMPRYNLLHLDTQRLLTTTGIDRIVAKIDAVDKECMIDGGTNSEDAFAKACVHASQIVDFQIKERENRDTDGDPLTGDYYNASSPELIGLEKLIGPEKVWDPLTDSKAIGFDRDPSTNRISIGAFRALDLADHPSVNPDDQIRVTILLLDDSSGIVEPSEIVSAVSQIMLVDIIGLGVVFAPSPTDEAPDDIGSPIGATFSNVAYRLQLREEGSNSSIFSGRADFLTFRVFDTVSDVLDTVVITGDPVKVWLPNRFIPPNRLAFTYFDSDIVEFFREVTATFIYETRDGAIEWDRSSFSFGQDAFLTIKDEDLNRRPDSQERYDLPIDGFVFFELGKERVCSETDPSVSGKPTNGATSCAPGEKDSFFNNIDATLLETGTNTGTFVAQITMPRSILLDATPGSPGTAPESVITQQRDLEANYIDIRDRSSITQEFDDIANIRTTHGDVVLDRAAMPPGSILFQEIHDNDFNINVDIRENIKLDQLVATRDITTGALAADGKVHDGTVFDSDDPRINSILAELREDSDLDLATALVTNPDFANLAPIYEVNVFQTGTGRLVSLLAVGITTVEGTPAISKLDDRYGIGITVDTGDTLAVLPILDRSGTPVVTAEETGPNTGIFEFEARLPGPAEEDRFPIVLPKILTTGTLDNPVITSNQPIQATYFDPSDESGESEDEQELATFLTNTARLKTDRLEYGLGDRLDIIIEEPDFNLDSRAVDEVSFSILDIVTDKFDTEFGANADEEDFGTVIDSLSDTRTNLTRFRETNFNSGVFTVAIEEITNSLIDRGETARLLYFDKTPSGGGSEIRVQYTFMVVAILPEIVFDKEEYTPFDEVIVSIISPDSNNDPDRIETITPLISSSSESLGRDTFPETGPNTGIFEEDFDLTPSKDRFPGDLRAVREDGITIEFRIDSDTVATKSVFVNYHVGQVMFDKDAFSLTERGVLRVIDPDSNENPDTIDTLNVRFWSTTDRGGLLVTLRETGDRTGIFEEIITFTPDEESSGTRLRVTEGDTITAKYTDNTLPAPAALDAEEVFTVEVEELFASALMGATVALLERAVASELDIVDQTGATLADASIGSQVLIQSTITNSQTKKQPFAYIVQIKDVNGVTVSLSWVSGELPASEQLSVAQSWIPEATGEHVAEVFVWESIDRPTALSPVRTTTLIVS